MNRPFYAFGVLIAFLTLAMLAIGLSSRPSVKQPSAGGSGSGLPNRRPGVTLYVMVLEDEMKLELPGLTECETANEPVACGMAAKRAGFAAGRDYATGHGLERAAGDVFQDPGLWRSESLAEATKPVSGLSGVTIESVALLRIYEFDQSTLATGYDAAYDRAMAGDLQPFQQSASISEREDSTESDADPMLLLFESLARSKMPHNERKTNPARWAGRRWDYEAQAIFLGAQNRLWKCLELARLDDEWLATAEQTGLVDRAKTSNQRGPTWAEYSAWIGSKQWTVAGRDSQNRASIAFWGQPKGELLQIAVAGLNRVAELLHDLVAQWLEQAAERTAQRASNSMAPVSPK